MDKKKTGGVGSALTDDWESDLAAIIEKTNQNLNLLRKIGEKRDDPKVTTPSGLLSRTRSSPLMVASSSNATDHRSTTDTSTSINKWKKVLDESTSMKRHIATKLLDSNKAKADGVRGAWDTALTNQDDQREAAMAAPTSSRSFQPHVSLEEIKKSLEVDIASRAKSIENLVADLRVDFKGLAAETGLSTKKLDDFVTKIEAKIQRFEGFEVDATKLLEALPRVEAQTIALLKWKGMVEYDMQSASTKLESLLSVQEKCARLDRQVSDVELKLQRLPTMDGLVDTLTKRVQELERQASRASADGHGIAHAVEVAVNKAIASFDERLSKRMDAVTEMHEAKTTSFMKTLQSQRENHEKSIQFAIDAGLGDLHMEIDQVQKRVDSRLQDIHTSTDSRVAILNKRVGAVEAAVTDTQKTADSDDQLRKVLVRLDTCVTKQHVGAVVADHLAEQAESTRRMEAALAKTQQDHDRKWSETSQALATTQDELSQVHVTVATVQSAIQKASNVENQVLRAKLLQCVAELDELRQVKQDMDAHLERRNKDHDAAVARLATQLAASDKKREDEVHHLTTALMDKSMQVATTAGKLAGLQESWKREVDQLHSTRAMMHQARRESAEMRAALQQCQGELARQNLEKKQSLDSIRRLTAQWTKAREDVALAKTSLHKTMQQHADRVCMLEATIAKLQTTHASTLAEAKRSSAATRDVERLASELASVQFDYQSVQQELERVKVSKAKLDSQLRTAISQVKTEEPEGTTAARALQVGLDHAFAKTKDLLKREGEVVAAVQALRSALAITSAAAVEPSTLVDTLQAMQTSVHEWHTGRSGNSDETNKLQRQVDATQDEHQAQRLQWEAKLQTHLDELSVVLTEKAAVEQDLARHKDLLTVEIARARQVEGEVAAIAQEFAAKELELHDQVDELKKSVAELAHEKAAMESTMASLEASQMDATNAAQSTSDNLASLRDKLAESEARYGRATEEINALEAELEEMHNSKQTLTDKYSTVCSDLTKAQQALGDAQVELHVLKVEVAQAQELHQEHEANLAAAQAKVARLTTELDSREATLLNVQAELAKIQQASVDVATIDRTRLEDEMAKSENLLAEKKAVEEKLRMWTERDATMQQERAQWEIERDARDLQVQSQIRALTDDLTAQQEAAAMREAELVALASHVTSITGSPSRGATSTSNEPLALLKASIDTLQAAAAAKQQVLDAVVQSLQTCVVRSDDKRALPSILEELPELQPVLEHIECLHVEKASATGRVADLVEELLRRDELHEQLALEVDAQRATISSLQGAKDLLESDKTVSITELEATKAQWKEDDRVHEAQVKAMLADYDALQSHESQLKEQLDALVQQCQQELGTMQTSVIAELEEKLARLDADMQSYAADTAQQEAAQDATVADMDKGQDNLHRLQRDVAMLRNQLSMAPAALYHINHLHGIVAVPEKAPAVRGLDRTHIMTMQSQLAAEVEVTALQLTLNDQDISYVAKSIQRLPDLAQRLAQVTSAVKSVRRPDKRSGTSIESSPAEGGQTPLIKQDATIAVALPAGLQGSEDTTVQFTRAIPAEGSSVAFTKQNETDPVTSSVATEAEMHDQIRLESTSSPSPLRASVVDESPELNDHGEDEEIESNPDEFGEESVASMEASYDLVAEPPVANGAEEELSPSKDAGDVLHAHNETATAIEKSDVGVPHPARSVDSALALTTSSDAPLETPSQMHIKISKPDTHVDDPASESTDANIAPETSPALVEVESQRVDATEFDDGDAEDVASNADEEDESHASMASEIGVIDEATSGLLQTAHAAALHEETEGQSHRGDVQYDAARNAHAEVDSAVESAPSPTSIAGAALEAAPDAIEYDDGVDVESDPDNFDEGHDDESDDDDPPSPLYSRAVPSSSLSQQVSSHEQEALHDENAHVGNTAATVPTPSPASTAPSRSLPHLSLRRHLGDEDDMDDVEGMMLEQMRQSVGQKQAAQDDSFDDEFDDHASVQSSPRHNVEHDHGGSGSEAPSDTEAASPSYRHQGQHAFAVGEPDTTVLSATNEPDGEGQLEKVTNDAAPSGEMPAVRPNDTEEDDVDSEGEHLEESFEAGSPVHATEKLEARPDNSIPVSASPLLGDDEEHDEHEEPQKVTDHSTRLTHEASATAPHTVADKCGHATSDLEPAQHEPNHGRDDDVLSEEGDDESLASMEQSTGDDRLNGSFTESPLKSLNMGGDELSPVNATLKDTPDAKYAQGAVASSPSVQAQTFPALVLRQQYGDDDDDDELDPDVQALAAQRLQGAGTGQPSAASLDASFDEDFDQVAAPSHAINVHADDGQDVPSEDEELSNDFDNELDSSRASLPEHEGVAGANDSVTTPPVSTLHHADVSGLKHDSAEQTRTALSASANAPVPDERLSKSDDSHAPAPTEGEKAPNIPPHDAPSHGRPGYEEAPPSLSGPINDASDDDDELDAESVGEVSSQSIDQSMEADEGSPRRVATPTHLPPLNDTLDIQTPTQQEHAAGAIVAPSHHVDQRHALQDDSKPLDEHVHGLTGAGDHPNYDSGEEVESDGDEAEQDESMDQSVDEPSPRDNGSPTQDQRHGTGHSMYQTDLNDERSPRIEERKDEEARPQMDGNDTPGLKAGTADLDSVESLLREHPQHGHLAKAASPLDNSLDESFDEGEADHHRPDQHGPGDDELSGPVDGNEDDADDHQDSLDSQMPARQLHAAGAIVAPSHHVEQHHDLHDDNTPLDEHVHGPTLLSGDHPNYDRGEEVESDGDEAEQDESMDQTVYEPSPHDNGSPTQDQRLGTGHLMHQTDRNDERSPGIEEWKVEEARLQMDGNDTPGLKAGTADLDSVESLLREHPQHGHLAKAASPLDNSFDESFDEGEADHHRPDQHGPGDDELSGPDDGNEDDADDHQDEVGPDHSSEQSPEKPLTSSPGEVATASTADVAGPETNPPSSTASEHHDMGEDADSDADDDVGASMEESVDQLAQAPSPRRDNSPKPFPQLAMESAPSRDHRNGLNDGHHLNGDAAPARNTIIADRIQADGSDLDDLESLMAEQGQTSHPSKKASIDESLDESFEGDLHESHHSDDEELSGPDDDDQDEDGEHGLLHRQETGEPSQDSILSSAPHVAAPHVNAEAASATSDEKADPDSHQLPQASAHEPNRLNTDTTGKADGPGHDDKLDLSEDDRATEYTTRDGNSQGSQDLAATTESLSPAPIHDSKRHDMLAPSDFDDEDAGEMSQDVSEHDQSVELSRDDDNVEAESDGHPASPTAPALQESSVHPSSSSALSSPAKDTVAPRTLGPLSSLRSQPFSFQTGLSSTDADADDVERLMMEHTQYSARAGATDKDDDGFDDSMQDEEEVASEDEELSDPDDFDGSSHDLPADKSPGLHGNASVATDGAPHREQILAQNASPRGQLDLAPSGTSMSLGLDDHNADDEDEGDEGEQVTAPPNTHANDVASTTLALDRRFGLSLDEEEDVSDDEPDHLSGADANMEVVTRQLATASSSPHGDFSDDDDYGASEVDSVAVVEPAKEMSPSKSPPRLSPKLAPLNTVSWRGLPPIESNLAHGDPLLQSHGQATLPPTRESGVEADDGDDELSGPEDNVEASGEDLQTLDAALDEEEDELPPFGDASITPPNSSIAPGLAPTGDVDHAGLGRRQQVPRHDDGLENSLDLENSFDASDDGHAAHSMDNESDADHDVTPARNEAPAPRRYDDALDLSSDADELDGSRDSDVHLKSSSPSKSSPTSLAQRLFQAKMRTMEAQNDGGLGSEVHSAGHTTTENAPRLLNLPKFDDAEDLEASTEMSQDLDHPAHSPGLGEDHSDDDGDDRGDDDDDEEGDTSPPKTHLDPKILAPSVQPHVASSRVDEDDDDEIEALMRGHVSTSAPHANGKLGALPSSRFGSPTPFGQGTTSATPQSAPPTRFDGGEDLDDDAEDDRTAVEMSRHDASHPIDQARHAIEGGDEESDDEVEALMRGHLRPLNAVKPLGASAVPPPLQNTTKPHISSFHHADEGEDLAESQDDNDDDDVGTTTQSSHTSTTDSGASLTSRRPQSAVARPLSALAPLQSLSKLPPVASLGRRNFDDDDEALDEPLTSKVVIQSNFDDDDDDEFGASASDHSGAPDQSVDDPTPPQSPSRAMSSPSRRDGHDIALEKAPPLADSRTSTPSASPTAQHQVAPRSTEPLAVPERARSRSPQRNGAASPSASPRKRAPNGGGGGGDDDDAYSDSFEFEESLASDEEAD